MTNYNEIPHHQAEDNLSGRTFPWRKLNEIHLLEWLNLRTPAMPHVGKDAERLTAFRPCR